MDFAIDRFNLPRRGDQHDGVVDPLIVWNGFRKGSRQNGDSVLAREFGDATDDLAIDSLPTGNGLPLAF